MLSNLHGQTNQKDCGMCGSVIPVPVVPVVPIVLILVTPIIAIIMAAVVFTPSVSCNCLIYTITFIRPSLSCIMDWSE